MLAAKNQITTVSAPVAETNAGKATRVVRNSSRAPAPNSAAEPPRPSGGTDQALALRAFQNRWLSLAILPPVRRTNKLTVGE